MDEWRKDVRRDVVITDIDALVPEACLLGALGTRLPPEGGDLILYGAIAMRGKAGSNPVFWCGRRTSGLIASSRQISRS